MKRPNRFIVRCEIAGRGAVTAYLPNPGRMWELLFPDCVLYVTPNRETAPAARSERKTKYTVVAVERDGAPIFLHTHLTNQVARFLIERRKIPALSAAEIVRAEYPVGHSRFDFLLRQRRSRVYLEVKSCTLFGNGVAMFPDAVTERGRRHLEELALLRSRRVRTCVLFVVHSPTAQWFLPDFHTDLQFAETMLRVRDRVQFLPVAVQWNFDLSIAPDVESLEIPWAHLRKEVKDRGSYLLILRMNRNRRIQVGRLGKLLFRSGYYVYVGSAMQNLSARIARHARLRKKLHWHVDYLRQAASEVVALPIRSSLRQECEVALALDGVLERGPTGFGSSDCDCPGHLFWSKTSPLQVPDFHAVLQRFRMRQPGQIV